jgi:hypothetical protein
MLICAFLIFLLLTILVVFLLIFALAFLVTPIFLILWRTMAFSI